MLEVKAFRGYRFVEDKVGNLDYALTPPFDVIGPEERAPLASLSPYNMTHVILPESREGMDPYTSAARHFEEWIRAGVQRQDETDSYYLLEQRFVDKAGATRVRRGFFAVVKLPDSGERTVLGHERTFRYKIEDRLALTRATSANLSPVLMMYSDPEKRLKPFLDEMDRRPPDAEARTSDGVLQRIWRVDSVQEPGEFFVGKRLYIADGHHRFATACAYRDEMRTNGNGSVAKPFDYMMIGLVDFDDPGLMVYPAHRLLNFPAGFNIDAFLAAVEPYFSVSKVEDVLSDRVAVEAGVVFGVGIRGEGRFLFRLKDVDRVEFLGNDHGPEWRDLDVSVLHRGIFEKLLSLGDDAEYVYEHDETLALKRWEEGERDMLFLLKGVTTQQIRACADAGEFMPQKATYLFPKLPAGAVIHRLK